MIRRITLALSVLMLMGTAVTTKAYADLKLWLQQDGVNGGAITMVANGSDFGSINFTGSYGSFRLDVFGGSSFNGANFSFMMSSTTTILNTSGSTATLNLYVTQQGYSLPAGSQLNMESGLSGTRTVGDTTLTGIFQAFFDKNNGELGMGDQTNGSQDASFLSATTFATNSVTNVMNRNGLNDYSLTSLTTYEMTAGALGNFSSHMVLTPVPVPAGLVLVASGMPVAGFVWLRRRNAKKA